MEGMMRRIAVLSGLLVVGLVAACSTAGPGASPTPSPTPSPTAPVGGAGQPGAGGGAGGVGGGGGNTITREFSETVVQSDAGFHSEIHQDLHAVINVTVTKVDFGRYTLTGTANLTGTYSSDFVSDMDTPLGHCHQEQHDDSSGSGTTDAEGGLEANEGFFQFHVNVLGVDGSGTAVRDDSGCFGSATTEAVPWALAPFTAGNSGEYSGTTISGTAAEPREGGEDRLSWNITLPE